MDDDSRDQWIGRNVATYRGEMSQQALADAMRERGWKWSQATVWSVEKGERPVRLSEAFDLAAVLSLPDFGVLGVEPGKALELSALEEQTQSCRDLWELWEAMGADLHEAATTLDQMLAESLDWANTEDRSTWPGLSKARRLAASALGRMRADLEFIVARPRFRGATDGQ